MTQELSQKEKGEATKRRRWEMRQEKKRLAAQKEKEEALKTLKADEAFMREAIRQAKKAAALGDVPIGCVIVREGKIIARGYNRRNADKSVLSHAEIISIRKACRKAEDWRLEDCTMYVTLEPCPMCAGAIVQARIPRVVIGCMNPKAGCAGSVLDMLHEPGFNHRAETVTGVLEEGCSLLMTGFFEELRRKKTQ
jgi:tRNA(adenine34) deaminase